MFENTKKFCDSSLELGLPGFDLAVYKSGECIFRYMNGYSDLENKISMNGTERYSYDLYSPELMKCREETNGRCSTRELMTYLAKEPLLFEPGDRWEYSLCHDVLAALVEVVSDDKFENYVKKHIFDVLDMKESTFMLPNEELSTIAEQYGFEDGKARR